MRSHVSVALLALGLLGMVGCRSLEMPGRSQYFSNQPAGAPFFKTSAGLGGPTLAVRNPDGTWSESRPLERVGPDDPPLSTTPGLVAMVESAHRVDDYVFLEFKPDAVVRGQPVPSRFFLLPGGFAYSVPPPTSR